MIAWIVGVKYTDNRATSRWLRGRRYHLPGEDPSEASKWRLIQVVKQPSQLFSVVCLLWKRCNTLSNTDSRACGRPRKEWTSLFLGTAESGSQRLGFIRYFTRGVPGEDKVERGRVHGVGTSVANPCTSSHQRFSHPLWMELCTGEHVHGSSHDSNANPSGADDECYTYWQKLGDWSANQWERRVGWDSQKGAYWEGN